MSIFFSELLFHLEGINTPHPSWKQLEQLFGKTNEIRGHQLENELISLNPNNFDIIQDFISKFKSLRLQLNDCNIDKKDEQLILSVLSKLGEPIQCLFLHLIQLGMSWGQIL
jgi:hypothetical protein